MKHFLRMASRPLAAFLLASPLTVFAADSGQQAIPVVPISVWKVVTKEGDRVTLSEKAGILQVDFDVKINQERRVGHVTSREGAFTLELAQPVDLTADQVRIYFESFVSIPSVSVRPLILDEKGERISYEPLESYTFATLKKKPAWQRFRSHIFQMTEAGGAAQNIYDAEGGDINAWPDGKLRFLGFQVRVNPDVAKKDEPSRSGQIFIADVTTGAAQLDEKAFAFADALVTDKGTYRAAFAIKAAFQGQPITEEVKEFTFDPTDAASARQKIMLPIGSLQNAWATYRISDADGKIVKEEDIRWEQDLPIGGEEKLSIVDLTKPPVIGLVRIDPDPSRKADVVGGVFKTGQPMEVTLRVFAPKDGAAESLEWKLTPYMYSTSLGEGTQKVDFAGKPYVDVKIPIKPEEGRNAYRLHFTLSDSAKQPLDSGEYVIGFTHDQIPTYLSRKGTLPDRKDIKKYPYFRTTFLSRTQTPPQSETEEIAEFRTMIDESRQVANHITYMIDLSDFEVLPGVYDFAMLDRVMDTAFDNGCGITVRLAHAEQEAPYLWQPYTMPRSFDGTPLVGHKFYGSFAVADERFVDSWLRAFRAVNARYKDHPGFEGYYVMQPGGEWTIPDEPWKGYISDYSFAGAEAFRNYLKQQLGLDLPKLNARWGKDYKDWAEVLPPQPDVAGGKKPDLRPEWMDFARAKQYWRDTWFIRAADNIRSFDPTRVIISYGGQSAIDGLMGKVDYFHNGGNHYLEGEGTLIKAWEEGGIGWITEPHHPHRWAAYGDPEQRGWVLDWSVYVMTAQAAAGGQNLHIYYMPNPGFSLVAHYGGAFAYDRFELFKPVLRELHGMKLIDIPKQVAVIQDDDTLITKHRTTFVARQRDLRRFFELLQTDSIDYEDYRKDREDSYKMVILNPLDEVVSKATIDNIDRMVRGGAWLVMSARSGQYCPEEPGVEFPLLKRLGITAPTGSFEMNDSKVVAKLSPKQKLLERRKTLPFFTQSDFVTQLQDPAIGKDFFRWPYRWIPQSDYFGYFKGNKGIEGEVIASFPDGGAALTLHTVGEGKVLVFWGTPDMNAGALAGMMSQIAAAAGVTNPRADNPIPLMMEASREDVGRHYALLFREKSGTVTQKIPNVPDGEWFIDDMVAGQRLGTFRGEDLRTKGMEITYVEGASPLKVLRFIPVKDIKANWLPKYPQPK